MCIITAIINTLMSSPVNRSIERRNQAEYLFRNGRKYIFICDDNSLELAMLFADLRRLFNAHGWLGFGVLIRLFMLGNLLQNLNLNVNCLLSTIEIAGLEGHQGSRKEKQFRFGFIANFLIVAFIHH